MLEVITTRTGKVEITTQSATTAGIIRAFCDLLCDPYTEREISAGAEMPLTAKEKDHLTERIARYICEQEDAEWKAKEDARIAERNAEIAARARICKRCGKAFSIATLYPSNDPRDLCYMCKPVRFAPHQQHEMTDEEGDYWEALCLSMVPMPD